MRSWYQWSTESFHATSCSVRWTTTTCSMESVASTDASAVGFSAVALWLVPWPVQWAFYTEILPGFSSGSYHGLKVPITLPDNSRGLAGIVFDITGYREAKLEAERPDGVTIGAQ